MNLFSGFRLKLAEHKPKRITDGYVKASNLVYGVVVEDANENLLVSVDSDGNGTKDPIIIPFTPESYELKGVKNVFTKAKHDGKRIWIVRNDFKVKFHYGSEEQYIPFDKGWTVKGYIVKKDNVKMFKLIKLVSIGDYNV